MPRTAYRDLTHLTPDEALKVIRSTMSESTLQAEVVKLAKQFRYRAYHTTIAYRSTAGFPDLVLVRAPRLLFVELKTESGKATDAQAEWLAALAQCPGAETYLWRPSDLPTVAEILAR